MLLLHIVLVVALICTFFTFLTFSKMYSKTEKRNKRRTSLFRWTTIETFKNALKAFVPQHVHEICANFLNGWKNTPAVIHLRVVRK
jgi:hypothetical protein